MSDPEIQQQRRHTVPPQNASLAEGKTVIITQQMYSGTGQAQHTRSAVCVNSKRAWPAGGGVRRGLPRRSDSLPEKQRAQHVQRPSGKLDHVRPVKLECPVGSGNWYKMGREPQAVARRLRALEVYYAMYVSLSSE